MKYRSWKWRELKKWNETSFENKKRKTNEMISIELLFIEWIKMIVVCDAHWKFHCVYHETEMFSKRMKRNKVEWIDIPLIYTTISMSFCVITQQISTFSFLFFSNQKYSSKFPYYIRIWGCQFFLDFFSGRKRNSLMVIIIWFWQYASLDNRQTIRIGKKWSFHLSFFDNEVVVLLWWYWIFFFGIHSFVCLWEMDNEDSIRLKSER